MAHNLLATARAIPFRFAALGLAGCDVFVWFRLAGLARAREARWIAEELADEVKGGVVTADEAAAISDLQMRKATRAEAFQEDTYGPANARLRLYALGTDLAFAKHKAKIDAAQAMLRGLTLSAVASRKSRRQERGRWLRALE